MVVVWDVEQCSESSQMIGAELNQSWENIPVRYAGSWEDASRMAEGGEAGALLVVSSGDSWPPGFHWSSLPSHLPKFLISQADKQARFIIQLLMYYLASLPSSQATEAEAGAKADDIDWNKSINYIQENLDNNDLTLEEVARQNYVCKWHFSKMFKRKMGLTFREFLINERIKLAKEMLMTDQSVTDVCYAVGYGDLTHFGRMFQKKVGMPPSRFKRMYWKADRT